MTQYTATEKLVKRLRAASFMSTMSRGQNREAGFSNLSRGVHAAAEKYQPLSIFGGIVWIEAATSGRGVVSDIASTLFRELDEERT
jgi:hypothetical protein